MHIYSYVRHIIDLLGTPDTNFTGRRTRAARRTCRTDASSESAKAKNVSKLKKTVDDRIT